MTRDAAAGRIVNVRDKLRAIMDAAATCGDWTLFYDLQGETRELQLVADGLRGIVLCARPLHKQRGDHYHKEETGR